MEDALEYLDERLARVAKHLAEEKNNEFNRSHGPKSAHRIAGPGRFDDVNFMTEDEQSDDPEAIKRWIADLEALPGITMTLDEEAKMLVAVEDWT